MTTSPEVPAENPKRVPRVWVLKRGGIKVVDDAGKATLVTLYPREMRKLANLLQFFASEVDKQQPSRIYLTGLDE